MASANSFISKLATEGKIQVAISSPASVQSSAVERLIILTVKIIRINQLILKSLFYKIQNRFK